MPIAFVGLDDSGCRKREDVCLFTGVPRRSETATGGFVLHKLHDDEYLQNTP